MSRETELKPCPFCGAQIRIIVCADEGNTHNDEYENDPWSGLGYQLYHDIDDEYENDPWSGLGYQLYHDIDDDPEAECPIAGDSGEGVIGLWIYDTREEAIEAWNRRADNDR